MNIKEEVLNLTRLNTAIANLSEKHLTKMRSLVERIESGESSGDAVFDFCVACWGQLGFEEEVRRPYVELADKLNGKSGQDILWTYSIEYPTGMGMYHSIEVDNSIDLKIGRLNSDKGLEFDLKNKSIVFSAEPHLKSQHTFINCGDTPLIGGVEWNFAQGRLAVPSIKLTHLAEPVIKRYPYSPYGTNGKSQILVGEEVRKFFERANELEAYHQAIDLLTPEKEIPRIM
jgi:hypothetical protein